MRNRRGNEAMLAKPEGRPMKLFLVSTDSVWAGEDAAEVREAVADSLYIEPGDVPALQEVIGDALDVMHLDVDPSWDDSDGGLRSFRHHLNLADTLDECPREFAVRARNGWRTPDFAGSAHLQRGPRRRRYKR